MEDKKLADICLRHSMLICLHTQMYQYINCVSRGYLGEITPEEKVIIDKFNNSMLDVANVLKQYFEKERDLMEP